MCVYTKHIWYSSIQISIFNRNMKIVTIRVFHKHLELAVMAILTSEALLQVQYLLG